MPSAAMSAVLVLLWQIFFVPVSGRMPVVSNDLLHMYYAELSVCSLRDGLSTKSLLAVPIPGEARIDPVAVAEAPELQFVVVDGELLTVTVRSSSGHLPPLRLVISPSATEEDAEATAIFAGSSQHSISNRSVDFDVRPTLKLRFMQGSCLQFVRLDTFARRLLNFEYELPKYVALTSSGQAVTYVPLNSTMGVRFRVLLQPTADSSPWKMQVTVLRKPPIPPVLIRVFVKLSATSRGEYILGHGSEESPGPRGFTLENAFATVPDAQMANMIVERNDSVFVLRVSFEELHRLCAEEFRLPRLTEELRTVSQYHQMERILHPVAAEDRRFQPHHCTMNGRVFDGARASELVRLRLFFSGVSQAVSLHVIQPFPMANLQVHAVDGGNHTVFLEEEHYVPYVSMHDTSVLPFGWQDVFEKNTTIVLGDTLTFYVFFDMRELPSGYHALATGASAILHPAIRARVSEQDNHDSLMRWVVLHGGWIAGSIGINHQQQRAFLQVPAAAAAKGRVAVSVPRELLFSEIAAKAVPFIRQLFASEQWAEFVEDAGDLMAPRDVQVLLLTLFSLTQAESLEGTKWHLFISTLPRVGPNGLLGGIGLNVAQHHAFVADSLELNQMQGASSAVRRRRTMLEEMFKFVSSQWPWLIHAPVDLNYFVERFTAVDGAALASANDVLFIPPLIHKCSFSDVPSAAIVFNSANDSVELRFVRVPSVPTGADSVEVTCDLFQSSNPEMNVVESFLRRGFIPLQATPVALVSLALDSESFALTKAKRSRDPMLKRLSESTPECQGSAGPMYSPRCLRLFRSILEKSLQDLPASSMSQRIALRTDADRLVASSLSSMMTRLIQAARNVLMTHIDHLTDESILSSSASSSDEAEERRDEFAEPFRSAMAEM